MWIKSVIESDLASELTLLTRYCLFSVAQPCFNIYVPQMAYGDNDALLYTFRQISLNQINDQ